MPTGVYQRKSVSDRLWMRTLKSEGCWLWQGSKNPNKYGQIYVDGRLQLASRISYSVTFGAIPVGMCVLHSCDNPSCIRPDHLFLGTQQDNLKDMRNKGRHVCGEKAPCAKLKEADVLVIRASTDSNRTLADRYGVTTEAINRVKKRLRWAHVK